MATHQKEVYYRHGIWHLNLTKITKWKPGNNFHEWSPTIPRMVTHQPKDGHPPEGSVLQTWNLTLSLNSQNYIQMTTVMDGHLPSLGWSPILKSILKPNIEPNIEPKYWTQYWNPILNPILNPNIEPNIETQYWNQYWTQYWTQYETQHWSPILNPILNPNIKPNIEQNIEPILAQYSTKYWTQHWTKYWTDYSTKYRTKYWIQILNPILNPILKAKKGYHSLNLHTVALCVAVRHFFYRERLFILCPLLQ